MRIAALEPVPYALPFREPYTTSRGSLDQRELLLVKLRTSGGPTGLGETVAMSLRGGPDLAAIERELREVCEPLLVGLKLTIGNLAGTIAAVAATGISPAAVCAVDLALHDLLGKIAGEPVWSLLGAPGFEAVQCNATLGAGAPAEVAADAERWLEDRFETIKLKVGVDADLAALRAVRKRAGPGVRLRVDANGAWSVQEAIEWLDGARDADLELAEQPVDGIEELARVRRAVQTPIAADESIVDVGDAQRAVAIGACEMATIKLAKVGGIGAALQLLDEIPAYLSSALDGPIGIAAAAHLAQVLPREPPAGGLAQGLATQRLFERTIAARGPALEGPLLSVPDEPGLGVELDELALARLRLR